MPVSAPSGSKPVPGLPKRAVRSKPKPKTREAAARRAGGPPKTKSKPRSSGPVPGKAKETGFRNLPDPRPTNDDRGKLNKSRQPGRVIRGDISPLDVGQGAIGDCYFCAGLSAIAQARPEVLKNGIKDRGDGTYDVRLYDHRGRERTVTVDDELYRKGHAGPRYGRGTDHRELWPPLYEKAYAEFRGGYDRLDTGGQAGKAMQTLTGEPSDRVANKSVTADELWNRVTDAVTNRRPIAADTYGRAKKYQTNGLVHGHVYSILGTQKDGDDRFVTLRNPWGASEYRADYRTDVDRDSDGRLDGNDGVFRMRLEDFHRLFEHTDVNDPPPKPGLLDRVFGLFS